jgi:hypothetical protein
MRSARDVTIRSKIKIDVHRVQSVSLLSPLHVSSVRTRKRYAADPFIMLCDAMLRRAFMYYDMIDAGCNRDVV